jgi:inner membrane protein
LTHALSGAHIARATAGASERAARLPESRRLAVGAYAAAFPDIDVVASYLSPLAYLHYHRGVTHSIVMAPLWAALLAFVFAALWKWRPGWSAYFGIALIGVLAHIAGDCITSFGTMLFAPFTNRRYALSTTFIIDLWFTGIILGGLVASVLRRRSRVPATVASLVLAAYVAFQWPLQQQAIAFGERHARSAGLADATATAVPRPVSPFNWTVVIAQPTAYEYAHVNLIRRTVAPQPIAGTGFFARLDAPYRPLADAVWQRAPRYGATPREAALAVEAFDDPRFRFFRWFAAYPALLKIDSDAAGRCVWFQDLRFVTPGREPTPFIYGMCREAHGAWQPYRLGSAGGRVPVY